MSKDSVTIQPIKPTVYTHGGFSVRKSPIANLYYRTLSIKPKPFYLLPVRRL